MPRKRKRKFSLLSAIFLELASLAGIIAVVQPTLVLSWFGVELHSQATVHESASVPETGGRLPETGGRLPETEGRLPQLRADRPLSDPQSFQVLESGPREEQGRIVRSLNRNPASGWPMSPSWRKGQSQTDGTNQLNPVLPKPEGESFPRLATRQSLAPRGHRPTWDYSYPPHQIFP